MRSMLSKVIVQLLIIAVATPATFAAAASGDNPKDSDKKVPLTAPASPAPSILSTSAGTPVAPLAWHAAVDRAIAKSVANNEPFRLQRVTPAPAPARKIRAQGSGKGPLIMGAVSAVLGIVGTIYMLNYMKQQQKNDDGQ